MKNKKSEHMFATLPWRYSALSAVGYKEFCPKSSFLCGENGRITDECFDFLAKSYEDEGNDLKQKITELQNALTASV